jgi:uncharacterized repeat protein (TIGR03803 family)
MKSFVCPIVMLFVLVRPYAAHAAVAEKVIYSFPVGDGTTTTSEILTLDKAGNLYGVAAGGVTPNGEVFELTPIKGGGWTETNIYTFTGGSDGSGPSGGVVFDKAGNLYGVTASGGDGCSSGCGTVFELTPSENGPWTETVLYSFAGGSDGSYPESILIFDEAGNLYGGTAFGGDLSCKFTGGSGCGTVFELSPGQNGQWTEKVIHVFKGGHDGVQEVPSGLIFDGAGNLYGTTTLGGKYDMGTVFKLAPSRTGYWNETILHTFQGSPDGRDPASGVAFSGSLLYGTTAGGGNSTCYEGFGCGTVFELAEMDREWTEIIIHNFQGSDGIGPNGPPVFDQAGNLYGTTSAGGGGPCSNCGTAFKLTPTGDANWQETTLRDFGSRKGDGMYPESGLIFNESGKLFGTTEDGGKYGYGAVYQIAP